ncbi:YlmH/Sll1252 family protein [Youngiibacter fragilis]|uniref:RNA-binding protein n=1 Tax=Youngiibacter fragilis 232.1 TaxID=994573 RepID=V7I9S4_9CLOT|nr:YlmH/Sll1252 family protein [Youngiibacter fragilis]ETA82061.1 RNA-binding protein [Youngiibacter fragilis 232.1]
MDRQSFLAAFPDEDNYRLAKLHEFLERMRDAGWFDHTDEFLTPNIWTRVIRMKDYRSFVLHPSENMERRLICSTDEVGDCLALIRMEPSAFDKPPEHRDYLGAIMALGISRDRIGDVFVQDGIGYAVVLRDNADFLSKGLISAGRCAISSTWEPLLSADSLISPKMEEKSGIVASLRLDGVVAMLLGTSRSKALEFISRGQVLLNYSEEKGKACEIREGDTITIRGKGKFKMGLISGETQKGNLRIKYFRFV